MSNVLSLDSLPDLPGLLVEEQQERQRSYDKSLRRCRCCRQQDRISVQSRPDSETSGTRKETKRRKGKRNRVIISYLPSTLVSRTKTGFPCKHHVLHVRYMPDTKNDEILSDVRVRDTGST